MSVSESSASQPCLVICNEILDHKAVWITTFVVSILALAAASLILAQQYSGLGHSFSFLDKVPLGATCTLFGVGGLFLAYSLTKVAKSIQESCSGTQVSERRIGQIGSPCEWGYSAVDQTYKGSREVNCDFSYADPDLGLICVVDGAGHNNSKMHDALQPILEEHFLPRVIERLAQPFSSLEEAKRWLGSEIENFAYHLAADQTVVHEKPTTIDGQPSVYQTTLKDTSSRPAMSFGFIVAIGDEKHFVHYQTGDTTFTIKKEGKLVHLPSHARQNGVMSSEELRMKLAKKAAPGTDYLAPYISSVQLEESDAIIGCTDGITEFLTQSEFWDLFQEEPQNMLPAAKLLIQKEGREIKGVFIRSTLFLA